MLYRLIDGVPEACARNGYLQDGTAVSGLDKYLENNPDIAAKEGYYPLNLDGVSDGAADVTFELVDGVIVGTEIMLTNGMDEA